MTEVDQNIIKVVLKPKRVLVLGQLWFTFLIHFRLWLTYNMIEP